MTFISFERCMTEAMEMFIYSFLVKYDRLARLY